MKVQILLLVFGFAAAMDDAPEGKLINRLYAAIFHIWNRALTHELFLV